MAVNYTGKLKDGTVFDSSQGRQPLSFIIGEGQVIPGFEDAVKGLEPGEHVTASISAEDAYGQYREDMVFTVTRDRLPEDMEPEIGQQLQLRTQDNQVVPVMVTGVTASDVTIDANHPLAGQDLIFDIELVDIQ